MEQQEAKERPSTADPGEPESSSNTFQHCSRKKGSDFPVRAVDPVVKSAHGKNGRPVRLALWTVVLLSVPISSRLAKPGIGSPVQTSKRAWARSIWKPSEAWRTIPARPALHGRHRLTDGRVDGWHSGAPDALPRAPSPPICLCFPLPGALPDNQWATPVLLSCPPKDDPRWPA